MLMPCPNSLNLRLAPQKHPKPMTTVFQPSAYGPLSGRPLTKWCDAVAMGSLRPGSAVAVLGISSFFLNVNIPVSSYCVSEVRNHIAETVDSMRAGCEGYGTVAAMMN